MTIPRTERRELRHYLRLQGKAANGRTLPTPEVYLRYCHSLPLHFRSRVFPVDYARRVRYKRNCRRLALRAKYRGLAAIYAWTSEIHEVICWRAERHRYN